MPSLVYIAEDSPNISYPLPSSRASFSIGRNAESSLQLPSSQIAPEHAVIAVEEGQYFVRDNNSENGTYVNGERVSQVRLNHNDIVRFGEYRFRVVLMDSQVIASVSNPNMETSRIDLPPELVRRATRGLPAVADVRRVVESRPQSLKSAETSQIEPANVPRKVAISKSSSLEAAVVKRPTVAAAQSASIAAQPATVPSPVVIEKKTLPAWAGYVIAALLGAAVAAAAMHFLR